MHSPVVLCMRVVIGEVVTNVSAAGFPIIYKLALPGAGLDQTEVHVNGFRCFLFHRVVGEAFSGGVVDADCSWWLWVPKFCEGSADWHGLLTNIEGGADFGFSGGRHPIVKNLGDGEDRAVERGVGDWWLDRVGGFVAKKVVVTYPDASDGFGKVVGVTVEVQDHITGTVADGGVGVGHSIIQEPNGCVTVFLCSFQLLGRNGANGNEHCMVDGDSVVE